MIPRMAAEIGLNLPCRYSNSPEMDAEEVKVLRKNDIRTRAFIIINEHRYVSMWPPDLEPLYSNFPRQVLHIFGSASYGNFPV